MKFEGKAFIISIGSLGTFNFEIKKTHSDKSAISLMDDEQIIIIENAIRKYRKIKLLNKQIEDEMKNGN